MRALRDKAAVLAWRLAMVVCASLPATAPAAVYKCVEEGRVVFADRPCAYVHPAGPQAGAQPGPAAIRATRAAGAVVPPPVELRPARR
jgi:hypothetical protein